MLMLAQVACAICLFLLVAPMSSPRKTIEDYLCDNPIAMPAFFLACLLICVGFNPNVYRWLGNDDIDSMPVGEYCYYVNVGREFDTYNRTYTLPAKIEVYRSDSGKAYRLKNVYFENGGYLSVENGEFEPKEELYFSDQDDDWWIGSFSNERCAPAPFVESNDTPILYTILFITDILVLLLTYISLQISVQKSIKDEKLQASLPDTDLYITYWRSGDGYANYFHTTKECPRLAREDYISCVNKHKDTQLIGQRKPCPKCCRRENGKVLPKDPFASDY